MEHMKSHSLKFVFFLLCLSQVQADTTLLPETTYKPSDELFREVSKSVTNISEEVQLRLTEADVHVDKYFEHLEEKVKNASVNVQGILPKIHGSVDKFEKQICDVFQQQIIHLSKQLKARGPEVSSKVNQLKAELSVLKEELKKLYEEIKKRFNEIRNDIKIKTKPIVTHWAPIIKDIEEIILALITNKKEEIKKTNK